jgi:octaprenyl-diphosphate synthase
MTDLKQKILEAVKADLADIESALAENLNPHFELVNQVAGHILFAGGKRLRPLLMILSARLCGYKGDDTAKFSAIFEYLHAATLLHDDVVDGGEMRRGSVSAHQVWDPPTAVLTGDFLLARALSLAALTGSSDIIEAIAFITERMSQGEIEQLAHKGDITLDQASYMEVIRCKTAVLFEGACRVGALINGSSKSQADALADYGLHLGIAFQMADDLLDYTVDTQTLGKKVGADLREGKMTLPVIHALDAAGSTDRGWMVDVIQSAADITQDRFERLIELLHRYGAIDYTRQCAKNHIRTAKKALGGFDEAPERSVLEDIADYALIRSA